MPPSAYTGIGLSRTHRAKRSGPMVGAPGWLFVANTGDNRTASTPSPADRRTAARECAAAVTIQPGGRITPQRREARRTEASERCNPSAPIARASRQSLAINKRTPRHRQSGFTRRAKSARDSPFRSRTITALPRRRCRIATVGSGRRSLSVIRIKRGRERTEGRGLRCRGASARVDIGDRATTIHGRRR